MDSQLIPLPINQYLNQISHMILSARYSIINASTGSGKTTKVPAALLEHTANKILVLEPRRLAAKMQATRISFDLKTNVGELIGYLFKGERAYTKETRLLFITEGTLVRLIENDPLLREYEIIFLDEFHERHLETDIAFYHLKKIMEERLRLSIPLHVVFMSATIDTQFLKKKIPDLKEFSVIVPPFPQTIFFLQNNPITLKEKLAIKVKTVLKEQIPKQNDPVTGILIFVPGKREIDELLQSLNTDEELMNHYDIAPLHGELSKSEQEFALSNSCTNTRIKIVISTNIAESSLTIPFVNVVIDSGLEREYQGNVKTGFGKLITKKIARANADQRAGRSNRVANGYVYRLYSEQDYESRPKFKVPEVMRSSLMEPYLSILRLHNSIETNYFLEAPPIYHQEISFQQLEFLTLIDKSLHLTKKGRDLDLSLDLRLALIESEIPAITINQTKDLLHILSPYLERELKKDFELKLRNKMAKSYGATPNEMDLDEILLHGFLDVVGIISAHKKVILHNGENFILHPCVEEKCGKLPEGTFVIILMTNAADEVTDIYPIEVSALLNFKHALNEVSTDEITSSGKKKTIHKSKLGILTLSEYVTFSEKNNEDKNSERKALIQNLLDSFINSDDFIRYKFFSFFYGNGQSKCDNYDSQMLIDIYFLEWSDLEVITSQHHEEFLRELKSEMLDFINKEKSHDFDNLFPIKINFSDKRSTKLHYEIHNENLYEVYAESVIQDFYGLKHSPSIAEGKLPLTFKLLGPHKRALQVTKDLNSFWVNNYPQMQKELSRDYPRHHWPLDPKTAAPILLKRQLV